MTHHDNGTNWNNSGTEIVDTRGPKSRLQATMTAAEWHRHLARHAEEKRRQENTRRMTRNW